MGEYACCEETPCQWGDHPCPRKDSPRALSANAQSAALREGAAILLQVAEMEEHNEAIFTGKWKKGSKAWSGDFIARLRKEVMAKVQEAMPYSAERDRLRAENAELREALESGIASLEQFVKLGRIPENNQGLRDMRAALASAKNERAKQALREDHASAALAKAKW